MNDLFRIHTFYKYSLESFLVVVTRAINMVEEGRLKFDLDDDEKEGEEGEEGDEEKKEGEEGEENKEGEGEGEEKKEEEGGEEK